MDGVLAYLPAGPVTEADALRLHLWPEATVAGELGAEDLRAVTRTDWPKPWTAWRFDASDRVGGETVTLTTLAVLEGDAAEYVEHVFCRQLNWRRTGVGAARGRR